MLQCLPQLFVSDTCVLFEVGGGGVWLQFLGKFLFFNKNI